MLLQGGAPWLRWMQQRLRSAEVRSALQLLQFASSVVFVCLYVASTYSAPAPFSLRYNIDILLCLLFALDYIARVVVRLRPALWPADGQQPHAAQVLTSALRAGCREQAAHGDITVECAGLFGHLPAAH